MTTDLIPYAASPLAERMEYARTLASAADLIPSGLHDKVWTTNDRGVQVPDGTRPNPGKVLLVMETGAMLDLHPIAALSGIHVIEGKPSASAGLMSAVVRKAGHRLRVTTEGTWSAGDFRATAELTRSDDPDFTYRATWDKARAERAGLTSKGTWQKYPEAMAKARAISEVCREGAEDALLGVHYTPEELDAETDDLGELVLPPADGEPEQAAAKPPARKRTAAKGRQGTRKAAEQPSEPEVAQESTEPAPTPERAAEEVVDAEVVEDEQQQDETAVAQEAAAAFNAARAADALPGESEPDYQWRKDRERQAAEQEAAVRQREQDESRAEAKAAAAATEAPPSKLHQAADEQLALIAERERMDAEIKAKREQRVPVADEHGTVGEATVTDWDAEIDKAISEALEPNDLLAVYQAAQAAQAMTSERRMKIMRAKASLMPRVDDQS
jgi:hypothetical protein